MSKKFRPPLLYNKGEGGLNFLPITVVCRPRTERRFLDFSHTSRWNLLRKYSTLALAFHFRHTCRQTSLRTGRCAEQRRSLEVAGILTKQLKHFGARTRVRATSRVTWNFPNESKLVRWRLMEPLPSPTSQRSRSGACCCILEVVRME